MEVNCLAESVFGEEVFVRSDNENFPSSFNHSVFRTTDNKELPGIRINGMDCSL
jgi:hypothetical protein